MNRIRSIAGWVVIGACVLFLVAGLTIRHLVLPTDYDSLIRQHGGYDRLRVECAALYPCLTDTNQYVRIQGTNLPPLVAMLNPQYVTLGPHRPQSVNIVLSGGFYHACMLVVLDEQDASYVDMGSLFTKKTLSEGVYLFRE